MTATSEHVEHPVRMLISDWLFIDGTMDNHIQSAIDGSAPDGTDEEVGAAELPRVAQSGLRIRQAGWDQIAGWPHDAEGFRTWPAAGQMATLTLTRAQWDLVVVALRHWADVDERMSDAEGAAQSRAIAAAVSRRLAEQGWSPELR